MRKIIILLLVGLAIFIVAALIRDPDKVLPKLRTNKVTQQTRECPDPFVFAIPVDMSKVSSILYPGQVRGGNYKAHGGFRFDGYKPNDIQIVAPYDAKVVAGARYPVAGEIQYTFDLDHPCGISYRFGHLLTLTPKFQAIAEKFPLPKDLDSRTTQVSPPIEVKQGEVIATAVGLNTGGPSVLGGYNTFVDWGVYDYRHPNQASQDPSWATLHLSEDPSWKQYYNSPVNQHAVCWFDWISSADKERVLALPSSDDAHGKQSTYCK